MSYFIDLFSPETYEAFSHSPRNISGFRIRQKRQAQRVQPGDSLVCYMTRLSRWIGLLEVIDGPFEDSTPVFVSKDDPFVVRFHVKPTVWLQIEECLPIHDEAVWRGLSFTRNLQIGAIGWTGMVRGSLVRLEDEDGRFLTERLKQQMAVAKPFPLDEEDRRKLATHRVRLPDKDVIVSVPDDSRKEEENELRTAEEKVAESVTRESIYIQALIAKIGAEMGMSIWIPRADRGGVLREWSEGSQKLLDRLPLNYDDATLRTIEQIDVLWLKGRSIARAFEIEHTTSVYSGLLRMADLLALQPNMDIKLHIVAPSTKREKVFQEIRRPVFSLLDRGPLAESCTYLSYDNVKEIANQRHLAHLSDSVLDEYVEEAE